MGYFIFLFGGLLGLSGMVALWIEYRICFRIVEATKDLPDGLKSTEVWGINILQIRKWKKLQRFIHSNNDTELQEMAKKAMQLEKLFYTLLLTAMIFMGIGASLST